MKNLYSKYKEIINYLIVGVLTTAVSLASYWLLIATVFDAKDAIQLQITNVISWILAVTFSFFASRKYVFESSEKNVGKEMVKFYIARLGSLIVDMACMFGLVTVLNVDDKIAKIIVQFIVIVLNYFLSKFLVFNKKKICNNQEN